MRYGLATVAAIVDDQPETGVMNAFLPRNVLGNVKKMTQQRLIGDVGFTDPGNLFLGDDQDMNRRLGRDVVKSQAEVVFMDDPGGDLLGDDLGEYGAHIDRIIRLSS